LDDVTHVDTVAAVLKFRAALERSLASIGLKLNMKKCRVLADRCTEEEKRALTEAGFQLDYGCTRVLGSPVGDASACALWVLSKVRGWEPFFERVCHERLHPSVALAILRMCGQVKFVHLARSLPPCVVSDAAGTFDHAVSKSLARILRLPMSAVPEMRAVVNAAPMQLTCQHYYQHSLERMSGTRPYDLAVNIASTMKQHHEKLSSTPFVGLLMQSAQSEHAHHVLAVNCRVPAHEFCDGLRLRCGHSIVSSQLPLNCSCGASLSGAAPLIMGHLMSCEHNVGYTKTNRHHAIVQSIANVCNDYGLLVTREPSYLSRTLRPDMIVHISPPVLIDVSVTDPVLLGNPDAVDKRAAEKHSKYGEMADAHSMRFFPVVVDTYGREQRDVLKFVTLLSRNLPFGVQSDFVRAMHEAIQVSLLTGNVRVVTQASARVRQLATRWW
jgi:hypothetical protein